MSKSNIQFLKKRKLLCSEFRILQKNNRPESGFTNRNLLEESLKMIHRESCTISELNHENLFQ